MATGNEYSSLQYAFRVAFHTISEFVPEVAEAIVTMYLDEVMKLPNSQQECREIATGFSKKWKFHITLGAIDGKHVAIRCPTKAGSTYYNYSQTSVKQPLKGNVKSGLLKRWSLKEGLRV